MKKIKALVKYTDWLIHLSGRNEIKPEVGDDLYDIITNEHIRVTEDDFNCFGEAPSIIYYYSDCYVEVDYDQTPNLDGLIKDGYTFICPEHGLHPNCGCLDNQFKVINDDIVTEQCKIFSLEEGIKLLDYLISHKEDNFRFQYLIDRRNILQQELNNLENVKTQ